MKLKTHHKFFSLIIILSILAIAGTFTWALAYSGFAAAFAKAVIGILLFYAFDHFVMKDVDTLNQLMKGNTAYAIFLLSYALILAACIATG